jgi:hypothetical protein
MRPHFISLAAIFLLSAALFAYIQFAGSNIVDYDGYYHIKMAELIREEGIPTPFPWLPYTVLSPDRYTDHHLLFHILQIPFTSLGDLRIAAKVSAVFFAALAFTVFAWILYRYEIPFPAFWILMLFASSPPFLYRMSMPRAPSLALAFQLLGFHYILQRKYLALFILSTLFVWAYNGFPTLLALAGAGLLVFYFTERKIEFRLTGSVLGGIAAGLIVNPYFPRNVFFLYDHIVPKIFASNYATSVGSEWYPYNSLALLTLATLALLSYLIAVTITNRNEFLEDKPRLFWFLISTLYLFLLFKSRRFIEYFPPCAILFLAFATRPYLRDEKVLKRVAFSACIALAVFLGITLGHARKDIRSEPDTFAYKGAAEWLAQHTPEGSIVFHTDWDDFPMLFFYNTHNRYIVGLDADNLRLKDEKFYRLWEKITLAEVPDPSDAIVNQFHSHYVFTDTQHDGFIGIADHNKRFHRMYADRFTIVYRVD